MNRRVLVVGGLLVIPLLVLLALAFRFNPNVIDSPLVGKPAPGFALHDLYGRLVRLEELQGKPVILNFWATWCQPCIVEHPILQEGSRRFRGRAHFLGVVYQDEPEAIRAFLRQRGVWGPSLLDSDGRVAIAYGVYGAPETFFIDAEGVVAEKITGPVGATALVRIVEGLLPVEAEGDSSPLGL